ncbi:Crp/Fnr family transcriptional regulator [Phenylobacterium sp.]|jgi:CRP-like cAMP-binding protein|uniref:Crp/Fnr family transcriptional regulator n=1 Tax=Phenylobacterium sp. TaxID=1871053 RepID=UPI002E302228|nr:Crp/Fnr family transcriptional regulator [Phenylobacterium sp.]HEX2560641.1 Crp/Fnr family transcriptional regulator [Phenylobacterium sp.]
MQDLLQSASGYDRLLLKLESIADLSSEERAALRRLPIRVRDLSAGEDFVQDGDIPTESCLLLEGLACRYKLLEGGGRQILSFHIPGDIPDMQSLHLTRMDYSMSALGRSQVAYIPHASLRTLTREHPGLAEIFWRDTLVDAAIFREWMIGLGRRDAACRLAHLFCELMVKFRAVHLANNDKAPLPLTQVELSDALGLSPVHVNRVLQDLRGAGLIRFGHGVLEVLDWQGLVRAGDFDPCYLHLEEGLAA